MPSGAYVIAPTGVCNLPKALGVISFTKLFRVQRRVLQIPIPPRPATTMRFDSNGRFHAPRPETGQSGRLDRRSALSLLATTLVAGCGDSTLKPPVESAPKSRPDVPLRILIVGNDSDAEAIRVAWSMTMEQPLAIDVVAPSRVATLPDAEQPKTNEPESLLGRLPLADVAIVPQSVMGEIASADAAVTFSDKVLDEYKQAYGKPSPAVANGLGSYGGETWGVAVGAKVLAVLALDSDLQCDTWAQYHEWVGDLDGKAAEPLADGWAATSFLNRCASTIRLGWLFNRMTMKPELDGSAYVKVLEQLAATAKLYKTPPKTPSEIWHAIRRGDLRGGIGYESSDDRRSADGPSATDEREEFDISVFNCPLETDTDRLWFGRHAPLACISSGCRQTDASKRFIGWLSGGERISSVRQQIDRFSKTRDKQDEELRQSISTYSRWLAERLQTRQVVPSLVLPGADQYQRALDNHVTRCLAGERSAAEALADAANDWEAITERLGRPQQTVAWKKTLGFGS